MKAPSGVTLPFYLSFRTRVALVASSFAINSLMLALPVATLQIYDRVLTHPDSGTLPMLAMGVVAAVAMESAMRLLRARVTGAAAHAYERETSDHVVAHVLGSWVGPAHKRHHSEYLQALSALGRMKEYALQRLIAVSVDVPYMGLFLMVLAMVGGWLVAVPLIAVSAFAVLVAWWGMRLRETIATRYKQDEARYGFMLEAMTGSHVMKSLGIEPRFIERYQMLQQPVSQSGFRIAMLNHAMANAAALFSQVMIVLVVACGAPLVMHGALSMGGLIACVLLSGRLLQPLQHMLACWMSYQEFETAQQQAQSIRALPLQPMQDPMTAENTGAVVVENLTYGFEIGQPPLLEGLSLEVKANEIVGISGDAGSGRSTLLRIVAGLVPPQEGRVTVSDMDPARLMPHTLSRHIAYLTADATLLRGTVMQNLSGFDPQMHARAIELSKIIGLDGLISQLPGGYDTQLEGSAADVIPPGLRQRVALVRALRFKPKLILYDQADRSLDREGYHQVFALLARLKGRATMIFVTDDKNLLRLVDRRLLLSSGKLHAMQSNAERPSLAGAR